MRGKILVFWAVYSEAEPSGTCKYCDIKLEITEES